MSQAPVMVRAMEFTAMDEAIKQIEKSNIDLEPEVVDAHTLRELLSRYAKAKKLVSYGETMLAAKLDDAAMVARATGVSLGKAQAAVDTGKSLKAADEVETRSSRARSPWTRLPRSPRPSRLPPAPELNRMPGIRIVRTRLTALGRALIKIGQRPQVMVSIGSRPHLWRGVFLPDDAVKRSRASPRTCRPRP
jgi:hypothetical protein